MTEWKEHILNCYNRAFCFRNLIWELFISKVKCAYQSSRWFFLALFKIVNGMFTFKLCKYIFSFLSALTSGLCQERLGKHQSTVVPTCVIFKINVLGHLTMFNFLYRSQDHRKARENRRGNPLETCRGFYKHC